MLIISVFFILAILAFFDKHKNVDKFIIISVLSFVSVVLAHRASDFPVYEDYYDRVEPLYKVLLGDFNVFLYDETEFEFGFVFLNSFFKIFFSHVEVMYFIINVYILYSIYIFVNDKFDNLFKFFIAYFVFFFISVQVGIVRQALAIAIFINGFTFIETKKVYRYMICCFIAFLFHRTAIILPIVYFVCKTNISYKFYLLSLGFGILIFWRLIPFSTLDVFALFINSLNFGTLGGKLIYYFQELSKLNEANVLVGFVEDVLFFIIILFAKYELEKKKKLDSYTKIAINISFCHILIVLFMRDLSLFTYRIIYYLLLFKFVPIIKLIESQSSKSNRYLMFSILVLYCSVKMFVRIKQGY